MLIFGKKLNFRPLLIGLLFCLGIGCLAAIMLQLMNIHPIIWAVLAGIIIFLLITLVYYPTVLQDEFNYFTISKQEITYYNYGNRFNKFKLLLLGKTAPLKTIKLTDIKSAHLVGKNEIKKMAFTVPFDMLQVYFSGIISMLMNPFGLELVLNNGQKIYLSLARDHIYNPEKTYNQANTAINMIKK